MNVGLRLTRHAWPSRGFLLVTALSLAGMPWPARAWAQASAEAAVRSPIRLSADLSAAYERLDAGYQPWRDVSAAVTAKFTPRTAAYVGASGVNRFGQSDTRLTIGGSLPVSTRWTIGAELHGSTSQRLFARAEEYVWLHRRLPRGWGAQVSVQQRAFSSARVETATAQVERYFHSHRVSYQVAVSSLDGRAIPPGHRVGFTYGTRRGDALTLSAMHGSEADIVGVGRVQLMTVRGLDAWGVRPVSPHWMMTYSVGVLQQGSLYRRTSARLGVRRVLDIPR